MAAAAATAASWPWAALLLLGAAHGINPAMGWLFAVALGLQAGDRRALWRALPPLAAGHALAIAAALAAAAALGAVLPSGALRWVVAAALVLAGARALRRHAHPARGGMRLGARGLALWSFLVATAYGAGLMALPIVLGAGTSPAPRHAIHAMSAAGGAAPPLDAMAAAAVHALGYLLVTALVAVVVYERLGLRMLRTAWVNLDLVWAAALVAAGVITVAL